LTSVQKYFKPLIFESKILFKIQKRRVYAAASLAFGPFCHSAHFRLSIGSHLQLPSAPPPLRSCRRAMRCRLLPSSSREEPHRSAIMPPSLPPLNRRRPVPPLTPSKSMGIKTPPPPRPYKTHPRLRLSAPHSPLPSFALLHIPSRPTPSTTAAVSSSSPLASPRHCPGHQSQR
jgi:hypothetical protein